ncbi:DUF1697 domain-containing protein [Iamia majanohamensis]|uniref:DUF1697 domain-containing protein n=1 Tax=Iamia majanohamensis TaxID=467976 RepID=A0AAE9Y9W0_9ACTN|nr:DUF1697 domain-containing protein [Iamia majanohamensis]WCO67233.1 DUF1697 domain-containing protein [Iamia majanohamensis]
MTDYVALLRGVAPVFEGMRNADLVGVLGRAGFEDLRTVGASGNLLFRSDDRSRRRLERIAEDALHAHLGRPCTTIIRSRRQVERLLSRDPFAGHPDEAPSRWNVTFLQRAPRDPPPLPPPTRDGQAVSQHAGEVFLVVDTTTPGTSSLMAAVERTYGRETTTRTWRVVERIARTF